MSFQRYPKYKDSGVEWLGEVPEWWEVKRLKHNLRLLTEKTKRRTNPVALENIEGWTGRFVPTGTEFQGEGVAFDEGDILFGKLRPYLAKAYLAKSSGEAVGDFHVMHPIAGIDSRFAQYQILNPAFIDIVDGSTFGAKMPRASWESVAGMHMTTPPLSEQSAIASFLDRETAKIDELIAEQQRLIELLKQKRQAVISHAVTKGLNPNAPMKDSGIEWLGEVPEHWEVKPLRWVSKCQSGYAIPSILVEDEATNLLSIPVIGGNGIMGYTREANMDCSLIAVGRVGALCGNIHVVDTAAWITDNALVLRVDNEVFDLAFLRWTLRSRNLNEIASKTAQPLITGTQLGDQKVPTPKIEEQHEIVNHLEKVLCQMDNLAAEAQRAIDLLQERRTALISAAVTGQIDVRNYESERATA